jgi:pimeloyl-ACP methyl ester carboxylesterase
MRYDRSSFQNAGNPTVVLMHGAFADASSWAAVIPELQVNGIDVIAAAVSLRSLAADADYIARMIEQFDGPVVLVGHGFGGAVATLSAAWAQNVVGLVYVAGFALDIGESAIDIARRYPNTLFAESIRPATSHDRVGEPVTDLYVKRDAFRAAFAADLPAGCCATTAVSQRPVTVAALEEKAQAAAWKALPSWYVVASADRALDPDAQRFMAQRANAQVVELDASHSVARSQPEAVANAIRIAAMSSWRRA